VAKLIDCPGGTQVTIITIHLQCSPFLLDPSL
jgi:hypothetical protein